MAPKSVRDVHPETFIKAYAAHLKANDKIQLPAWVDIVKTGAFKELSPYDPDWYYVRAAAIARKVYLRKDLGVGTMRKQFGGRYKSRGTLPEHFTKASGGLIRHMLQQLEELQIVEKSKTLKGGRRITPQGQRDLDLIAGRIEAAEEVEDEDLGGDEDAE